MSFQNKYSIDDYILIKPCISLKVDDTKIRSTRDLDLIAIKGIPSIGVIVFPIVGF